MVILNQDGMKPIYVQIAEWLETEILSGNIKDDEKIYSQYQLAEMFTINPATAGKSLNILANENIVYKKRGLGMFVSPNAQQQILEKRKIQIMEKMVLELVIESKRLDMGEEDLIAMIRAVIKQDREGL